MPQPAAPGDNTAIKGNSRNRHADEPEIQMGTAGKTDMQLRDSESTLQTIFKAAPIGIGLVTNRILGWVNDRLCDMLGRRHDELEGKDARILYPSDEEYERVGRIKHPIVLAHGTGSIETKFMHRDGHMLDVLLSSSAMVPGDMSAGLIFTVLDLTERKTAEKQRDLLFNLSMDMLCISGLDGYFKQVNPSWERTLGWTAEELLVRPWLDFVHPDDRQGALTAGQNLKKGMPAVAFMNRCLCRDGSYRWLSWNILPIPEKGIAVAVARDITERKIAGDALERSQRELSANNRIVTAFLTYPDDGVHDPVLQVVVDVLASPCGFSGYINEGGDLVCPAVLSSSGNINLPADQGVLPAESWRGAWRRAIEDRQTVCSSGPRDGQCTLATPIRYRDAVIGVFCVADKEGGYTEEDIRLLEAIAAQVAPVLHARLQAIRHEQERRRAEQEREELEEHMRQAQKMEAIGQLAGGVAHDFNNLLQVISGNIELMKGDLPEIPSVQETLSEIIKASGRATSLVRQLLTFSRRVPLQFKSLDLNDVIVNLLKMLRRVLGEDIELIVQGSASLRSVLADPGQIEQILINLCVNARDAMPNGGSIHIKTENATLDDSFCKTHPEAREGEFVHLSVSDTGIGIPKEIQAHIFEPFFTTKDVGEGTGLGLATVYAIAKRHNGCIGLVSEPGKGTTMSVYLPVDISLGAAPSQESLEAADAAAGGGEAILLAEDDPQVRGLARKILERAGYRVYTACDGEEALQLFRTHADAIDLAVLDVIMPKQSGHAVYTAIMNERPHFPVLFCSGYSYSELNARGLSAKGNRLIQKPYDRQTLLRAVSQALKKS